ncbi:MAG TPA: hypothetical protein VKZ79_24860 [Alphaproteobacteria bacterium]|nr:hypothetical protein [Alphaproteobacteria bacterium]
MDKFARHIGLIAVGVAVIALTAGAQAQTVISHERIALPENMMMPYQPRTDRLPGEPADPDPSTFGLDPKTGIYTHPAMTPETNGAHPFAGSLDHIDLNQYAKNTKVEAYYPGATTGHTWQDIIDMNGHRYMYDYYRDRYDVYDITDPRKATRVGEKQFNLAGDDPFGPFNIQFNKRLNKYIAIQCYETPRYGLLSNKYTQPDKVALIRGQKFLRGFRVFEVRSPTDWKLLSEMPLDPKAVPGQMPEQGSGCLDVPYYVGDKYVFVAGAPDDSYSLQEYKSYLYSAAQLAYDVSDPSHPKLMSIWSAPGQRVGEEADYRKNPRYGNKTSWMGARMPLFIPRAVENGGKYGYAAMGGLGFYIIDISDPAHMKTVSHLDMPVSVAGNEGDNIDVSKAEVTGMVYFSGYPMSDDCYEPYKDIYQIDVRDPRNPKITGVLPRPRPPKEAGFTDYCQRRGSFGPKRSGYLNQPGAPSKKYIPYSFYNAGLQIFDVSDPAHPTIAAYFVPKLADPKINASSGDTFRKTGFGPPSHGIYVEWDRHLIWLFTNHGMYAVSSPLLGKPIFGLPGKKD